VVHRDLLIGGIWSSPKAGNKAYEAITSPFDGRVIGEAALASVEDVDLAITAAEHGASIWRRTPAHERAAILLKAASLADERIEEMAQIISSESGKSLLEARGEAGRSGEIIRLAAFEGTQLYGDSLPLDANKGTGQEKLGFTIRQPVGIVVAISPFNYPALLVLHKIAPALAVGNAVVLKPSRATPMTAYALALCFMDAGLPEGVLSVLHGSGAELGNALVSDKRVRKISFTGSTAIGTEITRNAGVKKLSLELGASSPVVILKDADLQLAAEAITKGGYINAGQVCISVQRVIVDKSVLKDFLAVLKPMVDAIRVGDPSAAETEVGTLINEKEAIRVEASIKKAVTDGATLITGGERSGSIIRPAIVSGVHPNAAFAQDELFGPAISVSEAEDTKDAIRIANSTVYGLGSGVFTRDIDAAIQSAREIDSGIIHVNWTPLWRADLMPYGGLKSSGIGKEGVRSAVDEMTETKTIILHGRPW
jgi:acyl-CoA reductase-like NAD-dependent aldehyde dehydrogenase